MVRYTHRYSLPMQRETHPVDYHGRDCDRWNRTFHVYDVPSRGTLIVEADLVSSEQRRQPPEALARLDAVDQRLLRLRAETPASSVCFGSGMRITPSDGPERQEGLDADFVFSKIDVELTGELPFALGVTKWSKWMLISRAKGTSIRLPRLPNVAVARVSAIGDRLLLLASSDVRPHFFASDFDESYFREWYVKGAQGYITFQIF